MKNKVFVEVVVPELDSVYEVFIPVNRKVGNVIGLLMKSINELSDGVFLERPDVALYNADTSAIYEINVLVKNTDIRNGSRLVLI